MKQSHVTRQCRISKTTKRKSEVNSNEDEIDSISHYFTEKRSSNKTIKLQDMKNISNDCQANEHTDSQSTSGTAVVTKECESNNKKPSDGDCRGSMMDLLDLDSKHQMYHRVEWDLLRGNNLNVQYTMLYKQAEAARLVAECEKTLVYNTGELSRVKIMGRWHDIPRQQVAQGSPGLSYRFSGNTVPAKPWSLVVKQIRDEIAQLTGWDFNFVLINRYKDGNDHIGEHRDDEKDLVPKAPIASLSLGQTRTFVFKHKDARGKNAKRSIATKEIELKEGMLLMMNYPTNTYWYHSLPKRKACPGVRISMTFRVFKPQ